MQDHFEPFTIQKSNAVSGTALFLLRDTILISFRNSKFPNWMIFNAFVAAYQLENWTIFSLGTPPQTHGNIDLLLKFLHLHRCWQIFSSWFRFFLWFFPWFLVTKEPNVSCSHCIQPIILGTLGWLEASTILLSISRTPSQVGANFHSGNT